MLPSLANLRPSASNSTGTDEMGEEDLKKLTANI